MGPQAGARPAQGLVLLKVGLLAQVVCAGRREAQQDGRHHARESQGTTDRRLPLGLTPGSAQMPRLASTHSRFLTGIALLVRCRSDCVAVSENRSWLRVLSAAAAGQRDAASARTALSCNILSTAY